MDSKGPETPDALEARLAQSLPPPCGSPGRPLPSAAPAEWGVCWKPRDKEAATSCGLGRARPCSPRPCTPMPQGSPGAVLPSHTLPGGGGGDAMAANYPRKELDDNARCGHMLRPGQRSGEEGRGTPESSRGQMKDEQVGLGSGSGEVGASSRSWSSPSRGLRKTLPPIKFQCQNFRSTTNRFRTRMSCVTHIFLTTLFI